jgi:DNA-directed RNA polymerase specialized sigma24 family protein
VPEGDEEVLRAVLPSARKIAQFGFRIPAQDVDDVLQQASIDFVVQSRRGARATGGLLVVITRRRCLDYWRNRYRSGVREVGLDELREGDAGYPMECAPTAEQTIDGWCLARTWTSLSASCREVLARRFWKKEKTAELAALRGRRPDTVKRLISRCLGRLRRSLEVRKATGETA